jgi:hypothetical protein
MVLRMHYYLCNVPNVTTLSDSTTTDMEIDMNTQTRAQRAFSKLQNMGAPVLRFGKEDVALFVLSAEDNEKEIWADYWARVWIGVSRGQPKGH